MERLDKILANSGVGTRREVKNLVRWGAVRVDGKTAKTADMKVDPEKSRISVNGQRVVYREFLYLMIFKFRSFHLNSPLIKMQNAKLFLILYYNRKFC